MKRTNKFDCVCLLYASLSRICKAEAVKRTLLQTDLITCLTQTQIKMLGISEKQELNLTFLKEIFFYTLKKTVFFLIAFCSSEGVRYSLSRTPHLFFQVALWNHSAFVFRHQWTQSKADTLFWFRRCLL